MTPHIPVSPLSALRKDGIPLTASIRGTGSRYVATPLRRSLPTCSMHLYELPHTASMEMFKSPVDEMGHHTQVKWARA